MEITSNINYFQLETGKTSGGNIGDKQKAINPVLAKPKGTPGNENRKQLIDVFQHRLFGNSMNEELIKKIPYAFIEEYDLLTNSLVNQFNYFSSLLDSTGIKSAESTYSTYEDTGIGSQILGLLTSGGGTLLEAGSDLALGAVNKLSSGRSSIVGDISITEDPLKPYVGLYQVKPTGFQYILPYFDDKNYDIGNKFQDNFGGFLGMSDVPEYSRAPNLFKAGSQVLKGTAEAFLSYSQSSFLSPSTYVETPQYFAAGDYDTYTFKFNLLNTYSSDDLQKNYDLLFLLAFQNLPFREDIAKIQPPKIYTVLIPGVTFLPYCYVKSIRVNYVGNRRIQTNINKYILEKDQGKIDKKELKQKTEKVIVPDCYDVTIEFVSLVKPAGNFMIVPNIEVSTSTGGVQVRNG